MLYTIVFLAEDRLTDQMWFATSPKVGTVVRTNLLSGEELEYWTVKFIEQTTVYLEKQ